MPFSCPRFVTGDFQPVDRFLEAKVYAQALDCLTKAVSDVLVLDASGTKVFLGKRKVEPQPDWWMIGGRARPSESAHQAAARNAKRELGVEFAPRRFQVIGHYSFAWATREQEPGSKNGTADSSTVFSLHLSDDEAGAIKLDPNEYSEARWWDVGDICTMRGAAVCRGGGDGSETHGRGAAVGGGQKEGAPAKEVAAVSEATGSGGSAATILSTTTKANPSFHPALRQAVLDHLSQQMWRKLSDAISKGSDDATVATLARQLAAIEQRASCQDTVYTTQTSSGYIDRTK